VARAPGLSVRGKLTLSYAGFVTLTGALLLAVVWLFLLRYVPDGPIDTRGPFVPNRSDLVDAFLPRASAAMVFLLLGGLLGGWVLAGRMLAPLTRITAATRLAATGSLSHRVHLPEPQDEFRELADVFDSMLGRLEAQVAEQQRFAANASHELRTPLAITQAMLEVARTDPDRDVDLLIDRLHVVNARAVALTEALLLLSRTDGKTFERETLDLSLIAEEAVEMLLPLAERRGIAVEASGEVAPTTGSRSLLLQLTTNLLHNAIVHNLPDRGTVRVTVARYAHSAVLTVTNTGEVLDPRLLPALTEPFQRGSERIRDEAAAGVGLGLAIVKSITEAHGGTLTLDARVGGGMSARVHLPATAA